MSQSEPLNLRNPLPLAAMEANHRIANNLQLIVSLLERQASRVAHDNRPLSPREAASLLTAVASQVGTVGRLHRLLAEVTDATTVDFALYLREICEMMRHSSASADAIRCNASSDGPCMLPTEKALQLALISVEAVTNAIKYAHPTGLPGTIVAACRREGENLVLEIMDDGVGLPEGFDAANNSGIGIHAMKRQANSMGAALAFDTSPLGLTCRVTLPL